ncbi:electron transfer flavoprotein subunit beta [Geothrix rubra]|uniref:Electron transfer flavoprotein subunit beta n=1 Tax=Geothrix rubra TaxID=2927977 RepID=A0ABQ5QAG5_9BACT|nr:electron transfer flavoprotein subunit beta/FixA family protein [Geothrix rubra]GLH71436.1 electron transfer flavoprotein subunit beta [Geothrix rubra]
MKILVALKQVPDTETKIKVAADGRSLDPADVKWITGPYDEYALEEAIRIKEAKGAEVVALSVGGDTAKEVLRNALALGADSAVLLKGDGQGDALAVAQMIATYAKDKGFDLILCGNKGIGGDNAAMGPMLAELLGVAQANVVVKLELGEGTFRAEREIEGGSEMVEGSLPAVITAQKGLNEPRYASLKGIMAAKKKTIEELEAAAAPAVAVVSALALPPERPAGRRLEGEPAAQAQALLQALKDEAKVF